MRRKAGRRNSMEWNRGCSPEDMAAIEHFAPEQNGCENEKRWIYGIKCNSISG